MIKQWVPGVFAALAWSGVASAITLQGLSSMQVVQVDGSGGATVTVSGEAKGAWVEVLVRDTRQSMVANAWTHFADVSGGKYTADLQLSEGGPYEVSVRAVDASGTAGEKTGVEGVLAGNLWVLAGQSNMQGVGNLDAHVAAPHPMVHLLRMNHEWTLASDPMHILSESPDAVHGVFPNEQDRVAAVKGSYTGAKGAGLGLGFARAMVTATGRPVGLVATAHGGTSMEQWNPAAKDKGGDSLYGSMLAQVQAAGGKVRGVLWYQGESDASPKDSVTYGDRFKTLIKAMRDDFGGADMPFYYVQIGRFINPGVDGMSWNKLRAEQLRVEPDIAPGAMVPAIDYELDDLIHVGTPGLIKLGERLAKLAQHDVFNTGSDWGPRPASMELFKNNYGSGIRLRLAHVNGGVSALGRLNGFTITEGPDGTVTDCLYKQEVDPEDPTAILLWAMTLPQNAQLWYGYGAGPYCNVVDSAEMGLSAFGPMAVSADVMAAYPKK